MTRSPLQVIPEPVARAVRGESYWFVIGGQAVRCFVPYRPSHDVDFGVTKRAHMGRLLSRLEASGEVSVIERSPDTVHLTFEGIDISIFLLPELASQVEDQRLTLTGLLATKAHAILDRGTRRDFFDLYVLLEEHRMGLSDVLRALVEVYGEPINQGLMLRALGYFDDAAAEAPLPAEGPSDFLVVTDFFSRALGALVLPPGRALQIKKERALPRKREKSLRPRVNTKPLKSGSARSTKPAKKAASSRKSSR